MQPTTAMPAMRDRRLFPSGELCRARWASPARTVTATWQTSRRVLPGGGVRGSTNRSAEHATVRCMRKNLENCTAIPRAMEVFIVLPAMGPPTRYSLPTSQEIISKTFLCRASKEPCRTAAYVMKKCPTGQVPMVRRTELRVSAAQGYRPVRSSANPKQGGTSMQNGTGGERTERLKRNNLRLVPILSSVFVLGILMYGIGDDTALAYPASVCAQCHGDGRSGTPPATPTHIQMGLVTAPAVPATPAGTATPAPAPQPSIAPVAPAPAPAP